MKHLAVLYTNNKIRSQAIEKSLSCFLRTISRPDLPYHTTGAVVSAHPVSEFFAMENKNIKNIIAPVEILDQGHLSIIEKISMALELFASDYVSLHEHDVLYPDTYLLTVQDAIVAISDNSFDYLAYNNIIGVNKTGFQQRLVEDYPLSTLTFRLPVIRDLLDHKRREFSVNKGWCYLEPGYGGSYGKHFRRIQLGKGSAKPVVHINMNQTCHNHHLTDHCLTYEPVSKCGFSEWPGDLSYIFGL